MTKIYCKILNAEVRGLEEKTSKKGNSYFILYCENEDGSPFNIFIPQSVELIDLKKGDHINLDCVYTSGKYPRFDCVGVCK